MTLTCEREKTQWVRTGLKLNHRAIGHIKMPKINIQVIFIIWLYGGDSLVMTHRWWLRRWWVIWAKLWIVKMLKVYTKLERPPNSNCSQTARQFWERFRKVSMSIMSHDIMTHHESWLIVKMQGFYWLTRFDWPWLRFVTATIIIVTHF